MALVLVPNLASGGSGITQLTGDVTAGPGSGSVAATLANIPNDTPMAGDLFTSVIATPATPSAGHGRAFHLNLGGGLWGFINSAGNVSNTIRPTTTVAHQWVTNVDSGGIQVQAQPDFSDLTGVIAAAQLPAFTGDVTKPAGSVVQTLANIPNDTPMPGDLFTSVIATPSTPSAGHGRAFHGPAGSGVWAFLNSGGILSNTVIGVGSSTASKWVQFIDQAGVQTLTQPAFTDISGTATQAQLPDVVIGVQTFAAGGTYTASAGTRSQMVQIVGAGGGGNGATAAAAANIALGAGGGSGGFAQRRYSIAGGGTGTVVIGTAGTAGANTGAAAGTGGNSTFTDGTTLITANGGTGGQGTSGFGFIPSGTTTLVAPGAGFGGAVSTNGNINAVGQPGLPGHRISGTVAISGGGGASFFSGGARALIAQGNGNAGVLGAGGSGGLSINGGAAVTGGAGGGGFCIITEYA